jgi:hypothetical protein|tara:strand:- start:667 stop:876 length:210 start_codon:yes stop_codon:yes gene_type:complete
LVGVAFLADKKKLPYRLESVNFILIYFQKGKNEPAATLFFSLLLLLSLSLRGVTSVTPILVTLQSDKSP